MPNVLKEFGLTRSFKWRKKLTFDELTEAVKRGRAVVSVKRKGDLFGHALVIDDIINNEVRARDPLPLGQGKSYAVKIERFLEAWLRAADTGTGVIYVD